MSSTDLLEAISKAPDDLEAFSLYADWLQQRGERGIGLDGPLITGLLGHR
jgi:uncharacterized protein (TIGR02996 family)